MEKELRKIKLLNGRIITLNCSKQTTSHLYGWDKFEKYTVIPISEIDSMYSINGGDFR